MSRLRTKKIKNKVQLRGKKLKAYIASIGGPQKSELVKSMVVAK